MSLFSFRVPKNDAKYHWTLHVIAKMHRYGISESLIKRIVRFPKRTEFGVAPDTVAVMQMTSNKKKPQEIWVMYQTKGTKQAAKGEPHSEERETKTLQSIIDGQPTKIIISAWRYPGISPQDKPIAIPQDAMAELENLISL